MTLTPALPTGPENRREHRSIWNRQVDGELLLNAPGVGDLHGVTLRDVSAGGASLTLLQALPKGSPVSIVLKTAGMRMSFMATVAWCTPVRDEAMLASHPEGTDVHAVGLHIRGPGSFASMLKSCQINGPAGARH